MRWGDYIKRTAVRRVVWIVVGLAVYAVLSAFGVVHAQDFSNCRADINTSATCPDIATARSMSIANAQHYCDAAPANNWQLECLGVTRTETVAGNSFQSFYQTNNHQNQNPPEEQAAHRFFWAEGCPAGTEWHDGLGECHEGCDKAPDLEGSHRWDSGGGFVEPCRNGCTYSGGFVCAGPWCATGSGLQATGAQCNIETDLNSLSRPPDGVCEPIGNAGAQHCISNPPSGPPRHCIVHASGLSQCYDGTETGSRVNRAGTEGAGRELQPATPTPHPDQQGAQPEGSGTAGFKGAGGSGSFNVIAFSGNGNAADVGDNGSGPGKGSAPGWGDTIGEGPGNTDGEGDMGEGPGSPAPGLGQDFYEGDERTVEQLYDEFKNRIDATPLMDGIDNFFTAPAGGGACPVFTMPAIWVIPELVFDFHCKEPWSTLLALMGWVVLAFVAFLAFKVAIG